MIKKQIPIPKDLSADLIFRIIEIYLNGKYKIAQQSELKLNIKRLYKFQSNGWEMIQKQLNFKDSGYFIITSNYITFTIDLTKQIIFWTLMAAFGLLFLWRLFHVTLTMSLIIVVLPLIIGWINGLYELSQFVKHELDAISIRLKS